MKFDEKVQFIRKLPKFMVEPEVEVKAVAYAVREVAEPKSDDFVLGQTENGVLILNQTDIEKIVREYPDLKIKLQAPNSKHQTNSKD